MLPTPVSTPEAQPTSNKNITNNMSTSALKGRFRVSVVVLNQENESKPASQTSRSMSLDTNAIISVEHEKPKRSDSDLSNIPMTEPLRNKNVENLVTSRIRWLQDLNISDINTDNQKKYFESPSKDLVSGLPNNHILENDVFLQNDELSKEFKQKKSGFTLPLENSHISEQPIEPEQKARRLSSPTISTVPSISRKTHSIKCCKELEGLDLRTTVPLSPTRLHEGFGKYYDFNFIWIKIFFLAANYHKSLYLENY